MKVRKVRDLYKILPREIRNEYSIGIHGFDGGGRYWERTEDGNYQLDQNKIQETKESIIKNGLEFRKERTLLSTVSFGDLSSYITTEGQYEAGGVIIALPKVLRSESNQELFIGSPNEDRVSYGQWDRNKQPTSLSEIILPQEGLLNSMFVIGTYTKDNRCIDVAVNKKHLVFNKGRVTDAFFKEKQKKLVEMIKMGSIDETVINETERQQEKYNKSIKQKNSILGKIPFLNKLIKKQLKLLSNATQQDINNTNKREQFINELSNNGEYVGVLNHIDLNLTKQKEQEKDEQEITH